MMASKDDVVPPSARRTKEEAVEKFIAATTPVETEEKTEKPKKLSLELPADVHRAEKSGAALRGKPMIREIEEMLRARNGMAPWPADIVEQVLAQVAAEKVMKKAM